jgi:hypothetical protein
MNDKIKLLFDHCLRCGKKSHIPVEVPETFCAECKEWFIAHNLWEEATDPPYDVYEHEAVNQ